MNFFWKKKKNNKQHIEGLWSPATGNAQALPLILCRDEPRINLADLDDSIDLIFRTSEKDARRGWLTSNHF